MINELEKASCFDAGTFPTSKDGFYAHIYSGLCPSYEYVLDRVVEDGDRFKALELFRAFRIFDPSFAKSLSREKAFELLDKLKHYHVMSRGNCSIIDRLKGSWDAYHEKASNVLINWNKTMRVLLMTQQFSTGTIGCS